MIMTNGGNKMKRELAKFSQVAALGLALTFTFSCSGANGNDGANGTSCIAQEKKTGGFDILCGDVKVGELKNGTNGTNGANGKSCTIEPKVPATAGYNVLCGGELTGTLVNGIDGAPGAPGFPGINGANGTGCTIDTDPSNTAYYLITCGSSKELLAKAWCGAKAYDPATKMTCTSGILSFSFTDARDSKIYKAVVIGEQVWMAENLNYATGGKCYAEGVDGVSADSIAKNCARYGRLYDWATAMALSAGCNTAECASQINAKHKGICPVGWHLPSNAEWDKLLHYADGTSDTDSPYLSFTYISLTAGRYLKARSGWNSGGNGEDTFGFSALPGGFGISRGSFNVGNIGSWWSASESSASSAYRRYMYYLDEDAGYDDNGKSNLFSVRCVQD